MPGYNSNAKSVVKNLIRQFEGIQENVINPLTRSIAAYVAASNVSRIHNEGKDIEGKNIGEYKEGSYKRKREDKDKETQYVNLSFSGQLSKEFQPEAISDSEMGVGFISAYGSNLSEALEDKYNKKIWGVTEEDEKVAQDEFINRLHKYLNG